MNRVSQVLQQYFSLAKNHPIEEITHSYGVFIIATILAHARGLNPELASIAGLFHDIDKTETGTNPSLHAKTGAARTKQILLDSNQFSRTEISIIEKAVAHHMEKVILHSEYDELLKDADILERFASQIRDDWTSIHGKRLNAVKKELGIS